jgi:hypothetical protein
LKRGIAVSAVSREDFAEDFVGVEAAEFFGEAVLEAAAGQGDPLRGLAGLGQFRDGQAGTEELDVAAGPGQPDAPDAGAGGVRDDRDGSVQGQAARRMARRAADFRMWPPIESKGRAS